MSLNDDHPPFTTRMFNAFQRTTDKITHESTSASEEFVRLLQLACAKNVDLIALGGDIVNFPSNETVSWVLQQMQGVGCGIPFVYTAGNHDWHEEGRQDATFDAQRTKQLESTLRPLYDRSVARGKLYSHVNVKGVDLLTFDNSNYQINNEQLAFARKHLHEKLSAPVLMLLHMPLALPGLHLPPELSCGHPEWGAASDRSWELEGRPQWPEEGNLPSTLAFIELVQSNVAPTGRIIAILTGHVHRDFSTELEDKQNAANHTMLVCDQRQSGCALRPGTSLMQVGSAIGGQTHAMEAEGAIQYTTLDGAEGGYRLVQITIDQGNQQKPTLRTIGI